MAKNPKILAIVIISTIALLVIGGFYFVNRKSRPNTPGTDNNTQAQDGTQYPGPTEQEKKDAQTNKDKLANQTPATTSQNGAKKVVTPVITSANQTEVRGFVPGIVENNGICTATFTKGSTSFTKESKGFSNVSNTNCEPIVVSRSDFSSSGTWSVTLSYSSVTAQGISKVTNIEVQ